MGSSLSGNEDEPFRAVGVNLNIHNQIKPEEWCQHKYRSGHIMLNIFGFALFDLVADLFRNAGKKRAYRYAFMHAHNGFSKQRRNGNS